MKLRTTLILILLACGLAGYIRFIDSKQPGTRESRERGKQVTELDRDQVNAISIQNSETRIELRKDDKGVWRLEAPVRDRADSISISQLFTNIESLKYDAAIGSGKKGAEKDQLKEFGVAKPDVRVKLSGTEKTVELLLGKDAAVEGKAYARLEGSNTVYVIPSDLKNLIARKPDEFRDRKLTDLNAAHVTRLVVKSGEALLEVERKNDLWSIVKPLKARGDRSRIGDLVAQATTARVDTFVADAANLASYGLQEPRGTVALYTEGAGEPVILQIGTNPEGKDMTYARLSTRESVVLLPKNVEKLLEVKPNDLRDRNLMQVETDIVDRITIEPAGREKVVLARSGEEWVRKTDKDIPVNKALAVRLLNDLKSEQVTGFVADVATDLPKYGLDQPTLKVTLSSFASENTAETKAGEKPIVAVLFGRTEGDVVYAKLDDEPFVVSVSKRLLESIPQEPLQWQELAVYRFEPAEIVAFEVTAGAQSAAALERVGDQWKLAKGDGAVNQIHAQSLINTLASLRAVRWIGETRPEHGFDTPAVVVSFKTAALPAGKVTVGAAAPGEMAYATAAGLSGTFLISKPDLDALKLSLIETAPPAAAPPVAQPEAGKAGAELPTIPPAADVPPPAQP